jgi:hypothetical protein
MKIKAQAAMEYLMTYGWAILIVIIVAAALYALGVFNPATWTGSRATGFQNIGAPASGAWKLDDTPAADQFQIALKNNLPSRINITDVAVTIGATACQTNETVAVGGGSDTVVGGGVGSGSVGIGSQFTLKAFCDAQTAGSSYTASVEVTYDNLDTGLGGFKETGSLTGTVS